MRSFILALLVTLLTPLPVAAACQQVEPDHPDVRAGWNPTRWRGCTVYGIGIATRWQGPGVARNDCTYPWDDCAPIKITSLETGRTITVHPTMFCDCWTNTADQKIVDLDPESIRALGLNWSEGTYRVRVEPVVMLPDTAVR